MKYYDYGPYGGNDPLYGKEKTDNDIEAINALEVSASVDFVQIKNRVEELRSNLYKKEVRPNQPQKTEKKPDAAATDTTVRRVQIKRQAEIPPVEIYPEDALFEHGEYWDVYFKSDFRKTSNPAPVVNEDTSMERDDDYGDDLVLDIPNASYDDPDATRRFLISSDTGEIMDEPELEDVLDLSLEEDRPTEQQTSNPFLRFFRRGKRPADRANQQPATEETLSAPRVVSRRRKYGMAAAATIVGVLLIGMLAVAEPWVPAPVDDYSVPTPVVLGSPVQIAVGDEYTLAVALGENEEIFSIATPDQDILQLEDNSVTARGEWEDSKVIIQTIEKQVPGPVLKPFKLFGLDLTEPYNQLRANLRALLGVEKKTPPRTERRILHIYEQSIVVKGYETTIAATPINLYTYDNYDMTIAHNENEEVQFEYEGDMIEVEQTVPSSEGIVTYTAHSSYITGTGTIVAKIGFYKEGKFVVTRAVAFEVQVLTRPAAGEEAVFVNGNYNGNVPILPEEQQSGQS